MKTKTLNQKKKELFELLVEYYSLKPEDKWCKFTRNKGNGVCCAIGHLDRDFGGVDNRVTTTVRDVTRCQSYVCKLMDSNDGYSYGHIPTPKGRVIAYLEDEIKKLS